jgi:hypothetical protein
MALLQTIPGDEAAVHLWEAGDDSWRRVEGVDALYEELRATEVLHPVSRDGVSDEDYDAREFATLDADGNLVTLFEWVQA